jgi:hypothetical protein
VLHKISLRQKKGGAIPDATELQNNVALNLLKRAVYFVRAFNAALHFL